MWPVTAFSIDGKCQNLFSTNDLYVRPRPAIELLRQDTAHTVYHCICMCMCTCFTCTLSWEMEGEGCHRRDWKHFKAETWRGDRKREETQNRSILVAYIHYCFVFPIKMKVGGRTLLVEQLLQTLHFTYTKSCAPRMTLTIFLSSFHR